MELILSTNHAARDAGQTQISKPMLAVNCEQPDALSFPVLATPKLDGIRCLKINGRALTRSFKPIGNTSVRAWIEAHLPDGVDGELMLRGGTFSETTGAIGRESGTPDFVFHIFDYVGGGIAVPYAQRMRELAALELPDEHTHKVLPVVISHAVQLAAYEEKCVGEGYEGVMIRTPSSPYKCGRSTEREGYLLKIKRFEDSEATVLDTYEGMSNQNEAQKDAFGRTKRSSAQDGKVGRGELGGFIVKTAAGVEFRLGYNHVTGGVDRLSLWQRRGELVGKLVKFKHQPSGAKDAPRFPQFLGFRETWDI